MKAPNKLKPVRKSLLKPLNASSSAAPSTQSVTTLNDHNTCNRISSPHAHPQPSQQQQPHPASAPPQP